MSRRTLGVVLIVVGLVGLVGTAWAFAAGSVGAGPNLWTWGLTNGGRVGSTCSAPTLSGPTVDVVLSDMSGMMAGGHMMSVVASPLTVAPGDVSFRAWNAGMMTHELVVLPLPPDGPGTRPVGSDGRVSEAGSLGEASKTCGDGAGDGIASGTASWMTLHLSPGRYELICNFPDHYAMGMFTELDVR